MRCKKNTIHGDLCRVKRKDTDFETLTTKRYSDFNNEKILIHEKFDNVGYPSAFTNSIIRDYEHNRNKKQDQEYKYIISPIHFEIAKESILVEFSYCPLKELKAERFLSKLHHFTNQKFQVTNTWIVHGFKSKLVSNWEQNVLCTKSK